MKEKSTSDRYSDDEFANNLVKVGAASAIFAGFVVLFYFARFHNLRLSNTPSEWGAFGDYVGGLVNPIVGMATVVLVIFSISIQRRELRASLQEMKYANETTTRISFEQSLFTWLGNYHSLLSSIEIEGKKGRKALQWLYDENLSEKATMDVSELPPELQELANRSPHEAYLTIDVPGRQGLKQVGHFFFKAVIRYQRIFHSHRSDFDAPNRTLFRLFRWIDHSTLTTEEKWHYCALVRAQLSWIELAFLFYNGLTTEGEKFSEFANKYAIFDNLEGGDFLFIFAKTKITPSPPNEHPRLRDGNRPWPYSPSAFDSTQAKLALGLSKET